VNEKIVPAAMADRIKAAATAARRSCQQIASQFGVGGGGVGGGGFGGGGANARGTSPGRLPALRGAPG
jgi:hypothetical protein